MLVEHAALTRAVPQEYVVTTRQRHIACRGVPRFGGRVKTARGQDGRSPWRVAPRPQQVRGHAPAVERDLVDRRVPRQQGKRLAECGPMGAPAPEETRIFEIVADEEDGLPPVLRSAEVSFGGGHDMLVASAVVRQATRLLRQRGPLGIPAVIVTRDDATRGRQRL